MESLLISVGCELTVLSKQQYVILCIYLVSTLSGYCVYQMEKKMLIANHLAGLGVFVVKKVTYLKVTFLQVHLFAVLRFYAFYWY